MRHEVVPLLGERLARRRTSCHTTNTVQRGTRTFHQWNSHQQSLLGTWAAPDTRRMMPMHCIIILCLIALLYPLDGPVCYVNYDRDRCDGRRYLEYYLSTLIFM